MKINAIDIKPGNVLEHQNKLWLVLKRELVQPGKGGAFAQVELRDLRGGSKLNERFRTQETVERVRLDEKEMKFLFMDGGLANFMDNDTFEQIAIPRETIGDPADFLSEGMVCQVMLHEGSALSVELPPNVVMEVVEADPVVRGQTASSSYKPGKLENGRHVMITACRPGHAHRRQHRRWQLPRAGQGLSRQGCRARLEATRHPAGRLRRGPAAALGRSRHIGAPPHPS